MANTFTNYLKQSYVPTVIMNVTRNTFWLSQPHFEIVPASSCPAGASIYGIMDTSFSSNAALYTQGNPMVDPGSIASATYRFDKDFFQNSSKLYGNTKSMLKNGSNAELDAVKKSIDVCVQDMIEVVNGVLLSDLRAQIDDSTAYSDAALNRSTTNSASVEVGSVGTLAKSDLSDLVEAVTERGVGRGDLVWLISDSMLANFAALGQGIAYHEVNVSAQDASAADFGTRFRIQTYEQIPIQIVPSMSKTEVLLVKKSTCKIYAHEEISVVDKDAAEWADLWLATCGFNIVQHDPRMCGKLTQVTE